LQGLPILDIELTSISSSEILGLLKLFDFT
jgi:hypothetical protein